jgi:ABC-2 type transport system ATP-binding protein
MVAVESITVNYGERRALDAVSLLAAPGEWHGVLGPNGGGKSTLFRVLATLLRPDAGRFTIAGETDPGKIRPRLGVVFQTQSLDRRLTIAQNMEAQGNLYGLAGPVLAGRMEKLLRQFQLSGREHEPVQQLSGGLARRVEIAKALLHEPAVLLLDEPTTGLDPAARREWLDLLTALRRERELTVLMTTHLLDEAERCDRLTLLHQGRVVAGGAPAELKAEVGGDVVEFGTADPARVAARYPEGNPRTGPDWIRFETPAGARFAAQVAEALPGVIQSITVQQPTLEDVFFRYTGARL